MSKITPWEESLPELDPGQRLVAYVWWCGDDDCDCTEARIEAVRFNGPQIVERLRLWTGEYHVDSSFPDIEGGEIRASTELNREARRLRRRHNRLYHQIEWPWDRTRPRRGATS